MKISQKTFQRLMNGVAAIAVVITLAVIFSVFRFAHVPSESMVPTLKVGDILMVKMRETPKKGDVILFYPHADDDTQYVKRLIAVGGDTIAIHNGKVILNGQPLDEPYLNEAYINTEMDEYTIPDGHFWAMGDNRNNSLDSRYFGAFPNDRYIGKVVFKF